MMKTKRRRSNLVPRVVFTTVCVGVVPVCVLQCSSGSGGGDGGTICPSQYGCMGVAAIGYDQFSVAEAGFQDRHIGIDGAVADTGFHVESGPGEASDAPGEGGDGGQTG
jgi:hypothetical protein